MFSDKEQQLIKTAEKKLRQDKLARTIILFALAVSSLLVLSGQLDSRSLSGLAIFLVAIAVGQANMVKGPQYEDLVNLLKKKSKSLD